MLKVSRRTGLGGGAEIMGASEDLGFLLVDGQQLGKPDQLLALIIAFSVAGKAMDSLLVAATRRSHFWQGALGIDRDAGSRPAASRWLFGQ